MIEITANGKPVEVNTFVFSGGELQPRILADIEPEANIEIAAHLWSAHDIMELLLVVDALRRASAKAKIIATIPYLPYARQDRVCYPGEANSLEVMLGILARGGLDNITFWDVHNPKALRWQLNRYTNVPAVEFVRRLPIASNNTVIVAPDEGARQRAAACADELYCPLVQATKSRDPADGTLGMPTVHTSHIGKMDFLIVDDICDGGRTFVNLAKVLRPLTDGKILLYVTHGIFSNGFNDLRAAIDHCYVANLHPHARASDWLTVISMGDEA